MHETFTPNVGSTSSRCDCCKPCSRLLSNARHCFSLNFLNTANENVVTGVIDVTIWSRGWWAPVVLVSRGNSSATTLFWDFRDFCSWTWNIYITQIGWVSIFKVQRVGTWNSSWIRVARDFMATIMLIELLRCTVWLPGLFFLRFLTKADISAVHVTAPFLSIHISLYFAQCLIYSFHICWWAKIFKWKLWT